MSDGKQLQGLRGLSMKQPWAEMLICGRKSIETRTWATNYRGPVLICSSLQPDRKAMQDFGYDGVRGQALGIFNLSNCRPMTEADERGACYHSEPGRFAWTSNAPTSRLLRPFPIKGRLGLFHLTESETALLNRILKEADEQIRP